MTDAGVGVAAVALGFGLAVAIVGLAHPFGLTLDAVSAGPGWAAAMVVVSMAVALAASGPLLRAGRVRAALAVALLAALAWWPAAMVVIDGTLLVDGALGGASSPLGLVGSTLQLSLYGLIEGWLISGPFVVPAVLAWAVIARAGARLVRPRPSSRMLGPAFGILLLTAVAGGATQALTERPLGARCIPFGAEVKAAAFSPAGDLLAVIVSEDPNAPSSIRLLRWPEATEIARWSAWADDDVAVAPDGQVFWSAWQLGLIEVPSSSPSQGVLTARPGSQPTWFATGGESPLDHLTWTEQGLVGSTPNGHVLARVAAGSVDAEVLDPPRPGDIGALWSSPDGAELAAGPGYDTPVVLVRGIAADRHIRVFDDPRSIAVTPDRTALIAAGWSGGTFAYPLDGSSPRQLLGGTETFVAVSARGDLAWTTETAGGAPLCTMPLPGRSSGAEP